MVTDSLYSQPNTVLAMGTPSADHILQHWTNISNASCLAIQNGGWCQQTQFLQEMPLLTCGHLRVLYSVSQRITVLDYRQSSCFAFVSSWIVFHRLARGMNDAESEIDSRNNVKSEMCLSFCFLCCFPLTAILCWRTALDECCLIRCERRQIQTPHST